MVQRVAMAAMLMVMVAAGAGCENPGQIYWSPDLALGAYVPTGGGEAAIIDEQGKVVSRLGGVAGGCAWAADSKKLYFAQVLEQPAGKPMHVDGVWVNAGDKQWLEERLAGEKPAGTDKKDAGAKVGVWEAGKVSWLFQLTRGVVAYMLLSPDGKWLAAQTITEAKTNIQDVYVFNLESRKLYWLSAGAAVGMCFTGEHRLALAEAVDVNHGSPSPIGELSEIVLEEGAAKPERKGRTSLLMGEGWCWMQAVGEDVLFTSNAWTFPGPAISEADLELSRKKLFRYVRGEGVTKLVMEDVGAAFMASPDGKRVLLEKKPPRFTDARSKLVVLELSTLKVSELCDYEVKVKAPDGRLAQGTPLYAMWRGNDQFCFVAPEDGEKRVRFEADKALFDVGLYRIGGNGIKLERVLSEGWEEGNRPWVKLK